MAIHSQPRRSLLAAVAVFLIAAISSTTLIWRLERHHREEEIGRVLVLAGEYADSLQHNIEHALSAAYALAALVHQSNGAIPNFGEVAGHLLPYYPGVSSLVLMPAGVISNIAPLAGNEKAIGYNVLQDPAQRSEAVLAMDTGRLTLAGPLNLVEGGLGAVGRLPVFFDENTEKPRFWGFSSVIIRFPEVLNAVKLQRLAEQGFAYELARINPDSKQKQVIAASSGAELIEPVVRILQVASASWHLSVAPASGWGDRLRLALEIASGLIVSLLLAYLAWLLLELHMHKRGLEALVDARTAALREGESRYRELFDANPQPMWVYDLDTLAFLAVNDAAVAHYGYGRDEFLGMKMLDIRLPEEVSRLMQRIAVVRNADVRDAGVWRHRKKNGTLIDVDITAHTIEFSGRRAQIVHVGDVTEKLHAEREQQMSEARFRALTKMSSDFYWETDKEHRFTLRSPGQTPFQVLAAQSGEHIGKRRWEIPYLSPDETDWRVHQTTVEAHLPFRNFEHSRVRVDGTECFFSVSGDPVFDASGAFQGYCGVGADITERKRHEEELLRLNEELEQRVVRRTQALEAANKELEAFSYSVSHDLRAPLRAIQGFSRLVETQHAGQLDEQGLSMLRRVVAGAEKMSGLIDDLLRLSRFSRQAMHVGPVDLSALAREAAADLGGVEPGRPVEWVIAPEIVVQGDVGLLRVAMQNLIGNAWKYSARREATRIEVGVVERDGGPAYFVRDNGAGFDMAYAGKLFGAFQRLHTASEFPGTGIGLATVKRIIQRHGGEVGAESNVGKGATFFFTL